MQINAKILLVLSLLVTVSCEKEPQPPAQNPNIEVSGKGIYVLNEGLFHMNNSTLTWYDFEAKQPITDWFEEQNGRKLGDTGNDLKVYGEKVYVVVNVSSQLEVLEAASGKSIKQIPLFDGTKPRQPRNVAFLHNKVFVCSFDGTVAVIDTTSLEVEKYIQVGRNPDGITAVNNKIYVANSGGLDFPDYDNTVSVIDFNTLEEIKKITVGSNPYTMDADEQGFVYVVSRGNYDDEKMHLQVIDSHTDERVHTFTQFQVLSFSISDDIAYVYYYDFMGGGNSSILSIDLQTREIINEHFISDGTEIQTVYGIFADRVSGDVFIADAKGFTSTGKVYCFDSQGQLKYSFPTGLNPGVMGVYYAREEN